jgi:hypothetical protein
MKSNTTLELTGEQSTLSLRAALLRVRLNELLGGALVM